jgi:hypothetical protein
VREGLADEAEEDEVVEVERPAEEREGEELRREAESRAGGR